MEYCLFLVEAGFSQKIIVAGGCSQRRVWDTDSGSELHNIRDN